MLWGSMRSEAGGKKKNGNRGVSVNCPRVEGGKKMESDVGGQQARCDMGW